MVKFRATFTFDYEIPDHKLEELYGTTDVNECARFDERSLNEDSEVAIQIIDENLGYGSFDVEPIYYGVNYGKL